MFGEEGERVGGRAGDGEASGHAVYGKISWANGKAGVRPHVWLLAGSCAGGAPDEPAERAGEGRGCGLAGERGSRRGRAVAHASGRAAKRRRGRVDGRGNDGGRGGGANRVPARPTSQLGAASVEFVHHLR